MENSIENGMVESDRTLEAPIIVESTFENNVLKFLLNKNMPDDWFNILKGGNFSHSALNGYDASRWDGRDNVLFIPLKENESESTLKHIIYYLKEWLSAITVCYNQETEYRRKKMEYEEMEYLRKTILKKKNENDINSMLSSLISE